MERIKFTVQGELPGLNEIIAAAKSHYGQYAGMKKTYTDLIVWQVKGECIERCNVTLTWYAKNQKRDPDNISMGCKFVLDGLVKAGILKNDGWKQIAGITHKFKIDKNNPRVEVELKGEGE